MSVLGQNLPRRSLAAAAARPPIADTKADNRRGRNGPSTDIAPPYSRNGTGVVLFESCHRNVPKSRL